MYISFFKVVIPVNYTSEFQELCEAIMYISTLYNYQVDKARFI